MKLIKGELATGQLNNKQLHLVYSMNLKMAELMQFHVAQMQHFVIEIDPYSIHPFYRNFFYYNLYT